VKVEVLGCVAWTFTHYQAIGASGRGKSGGRRVPGERTGASTLVNPQAVVL